MNSNGLIPKSHSDEAIDFRELLYTFWEKKVIIIIITFTLVLFAVIFTRLKPLEYEASALLQVESQNNNQFSMLSQQLAGGGKDNSATARQIALIRSRFILEPVVKQLELDTSVKRHQAAVIGKFLGNKNDQITVKSLSVAPEYYNRPFRLIVLDKSRYHLLNSEREVVLEGVVGKLINQNGIEIFISKINATPGADFDIVKRTSASVVNGLLRRIHIDELSDENNSQTGILEVSLIDTDPVRLVNILNTIANVVQKKDAERKSLESAAVLTFLRQQLPLVKKSLHEAEMILTRYREKTGKLDIKFESQFLLHELTNIEKRITETNLRKADLLQRFTEKHPIIIGINEKIDQLLEQKIKLVDRVRTLPESDQISIGLMRDVRVKNNMYLILLNKIQEMEVTRAGTVSDVRILTPAVMPDGPLSKRGPVIVSAALVLGLLLGCITVILSKIFYRRIKDPRWIEQNLNLATLAIVPYSKTQASNLRHHKLNPTTRIEILANKDPRDLSIEALRSLRTSLQLMMPPEANNIIAFLGIGQSVGKSFVSVNFSYLLTDVGKRVLLIDGDIRKGYLQKYFKMGKSPGLSEVLRGASPLENAIKPTEFANLDFLPCGIYPENPAELLLSPAFRSMLNTVSEQYDHVVIDTAPTLAVADSIIIGTLAGVNLLVLGSDQHQPEECQLAVKSLYQANIKLLGTVFNITKPETATYGGFRYKYTAYEADEPASSTANL